MDNHTIKIEENNDYYELISEIIFKFFTINNKSILKGNNNRVNDNCRVWFINFVETKKKEEVMKLEKYAIFPSENLEEITLYNNTGSEELKVKRYEKLKNENDDIIVFAKFKDNLIYKGYKFLGIFKFKESPKNEKSSQLFIKTQNSIILKIK
ncbi:hypothetical protein [Spiroplasma endosymbiont of Dioctria linearis]|uniref:hypothetical protein n=1 Tax=Spiroplasma endosymbiont of Dioctria linearis TaxID=3066290 RepID=UPI00313ACA4D